MPVVGQEPLPGTGGVDILAPGTPPPAGGATTPSTGGDDPLGWRGTLGLPDIPPDVLKAMYSEYYSATAAGASDTGAWAAAQAVLEGSSYFTGKFPGYTQGEQDGFWGSFGQYQAYHNQYAQAYQTAYGAPMSDTWFWGQINAGIDINQFNTSVQNQVSVGSLPDPVKALFTGDEISQMNSGSIQGKDLASFASWAAGVVPQLISAGITPNRAALENAYHAGTSASDYLKATVGAGGFLSASDVLSPAVMNLFSSSDQQAIIGAANGSNITPQGAQLLTLANYAASVIGYSQEYNQPIPTLAQIQTMWNNGVPAEKIAHDASLAESAAANAAAQAAAIAKQEAVNTATINANKADYNFALGSQGPAGTGELTNTDVANMAAQASGVANPQGAVLTKAIQDAMDRMKANFGGVLQNLDRSGYGFQNKPPDVGA